MAAAATRAQYGIEIFYPHENELSVTKKNGVFVFDCEFRPSAPRWSTMARSLGKEYYTYQLLLDLKVDKDWAVRTSLPWSARPAAQFIVGQNPRRGLKPPKIQTEARLGPSFPASDLAARRMPP
jgi:hypothetical protein